MSTNHDVVITGMGIVCPHGIGNKAFWEALCAGRSGIRPIGLFDASGLPVRIAGEIPEFSPRPFIANRKSLKVMARDSQIGVAASVLACQDAKIERGNTDPERLGVLLGADKIAGSIHESQESYRKCIERGRFQFGRWGQHGIPASFPLSFLRVLPNMVASHVSIAHDARGPCNTIHQAEASSLLAIAEAMRVIQRGAASVMLAGGASSRMTPYDWVGHCISGRLSTSLREPSEVLRPFDADRTGEVFGEGAALFVLEDRGHAERRGATILARIAGAAAANQPYRTDQSIAAGLCQAIAKALREAGLTARDIGHVNAHGAGSPEDDAVEAQAISAMVPGTPVFAPKSYFGNLGAAGGAAEMAATVLAVRNGLVPKTLNYLRPDPRCPVPVVRDRPLTGLKPTALVVNCTRIGQAVALVITAD
jgi:3-oxoacyl-[acyl-carrier-protein] synthase II